MRHFGKPDRAGPKAPMIKTGSRSPSQEKRVTPGVKSKKKEMAYEDLIYSVFLQFQIVKNIKNIQEGVQQMPPLNN